MALTSTGSAVRHVRELKLSKLLYHMRTWGQKEGWVTYYLQGPQMAT